jgi:two-component system response regulator EvgA
VLEGVQYLLQKQSGVVCTGITTIEELLERLQKGERFHLFILDLELPDSDGFGAFSIIREQCPEASILIYTMHEEPWMLARLARLDIQGVVSKSHPVSRLTDAVETIRQGDTYYNEAFLEQLNILTDGHQDKADVSMGSFFHLSEREQQVLEYLSRGLSTSEIAAKLFLSPNTIGTYRLRLMRKFDAHNVAQLISKTRRFLEK